MPAGEKRVLGSSMIVSGFSTPHWYIYTVCEYIAKLNRHVYVSTCACTCACDCAYDCDCDNERGKNVNVNVNVNISPADCGICAPPPCTRT